MNGGSDRRRPRLKPAAVLAVVGLVVLGVAVVQDSAPAGQVRAESPATAPTPVLDARRVPNYVAAPLGDQRLRLALDPVVAAAPEQSCLVVGTAGRTVVAHNPDLALAPASNQKLLTAHAALIELGADHVWRTIAVSDAETDDGILDGDLWLVGGGDPVLTTEAFNGWFGDTKPPRTRLEDLADSLVAAGLSEVTGAVRGDASHYDDQRRVTRWPQRSLGNSVPGSLFGLIINRGYSNFPASPEDTTRVAVSSNPVRDAAAALDDLLEERGVVVRGSASTGDAPEVHHELAAVTSPPLSEVLGWLLASSDNTIAELLVKEIGQKRTSEGTTAAGLAVIEEHVRATVGEAPGLVVADGSGIHDENRVSCATLRALLDAAPAESPLRTGLAVAGTSGTLRNRFTDTLVVGRLSAKTGWVNEATALSGFAQSVAGVDLTFSFIANAQSIDNETVGLQDALGAALIRYPEGINLEELAPPGAPPGTVVDASASAVAAS